MLTKYLGLILPDLLALVLLWLEFRWPGIIRSCISRHLPDLSAENKWAVENNLARDLNSKFFSGTFFIPGLISLVSYLGLIMENGFHDRMLLILVVLVMLWAIDVWYCAANFERPSSAVWHKRITVVFISFIVVVKVAAKAGYL